MARQKVVDAAEKTPEQQAEDFAMSIETVAQGIGWVQVQDKDAIEAAQVQVGVKMTDADLGGIRQIVEKVKLWQLAGGTKLAAGTATQEARAQAPAPEAPVPAALTNAGEPTPTDAEKISTRWAAVQEIRHREIDQLAAVASAEERVEGAKGRLKAEEAKLEIIRQELGEAIDGKPIQMELPLSGTPETTLPSREGEGAAAPAAPSPEAWRGVSLDTLTIKDSIIKKLLAHEPPITTIGDLADWQAKKGDFWAKDIKGIGEAAATEIADALAAYWAANPPAAPDPTPTAEGAAGDAEESEEHEDAEEPAEELASA